jgi:hypothetical protein
MRPVARPEEFGYTPPLIHTRRGGEAEMAAECVSAELELGAGDVVLLASDALAESLCRKFVHVGGDSAVVGDWVRSLLGGAGGCRDRFTSEVAALRGANLLRDDDVALLIISTTPGASGGGRG